MSTYKYIVEMYSIILQGTQYTFRHFFTYIVTNYCGKIHMYVGFVWWFVMPFGPSTLNQNSMHIIRNTFLFWQNNVDKIKFLTNAVYLTGIG